MRVAALYDIHGNLPALEAVLHEIPQAEVDEIVVGGDVMPGPLPTQALTRLLDLDIPVRFILGNGESAVLAQKEGKDISAVPSQFQGIIRWTADQLLDEHEQMLKRWPSTLHLEIDGFGEALFCHATPRSDTEIFTRVTPEDRLQNVFAGWEGSLIICGHTHMQFDRMIRGMRVVNAGSVGMPFGQPGAYWLLLGPEIQLRHTRYDLLNAAELIRSTDYPQAQEFAANNVLKPQTEEEALQIFSKVELLPEKTR